MIDNRTTRLDLPLPNVDNYLEDDVVRLAEALTSLDEKVATVGESGKLTEKQIPESVAVLDSNKKLPAINLPDTAVQTDKEGKIPASVVPADKLGLASDEELSAVAQAAQAADDKAQEALEKGGDPVLAAKWIQKRSAMWKGYAPADGQLLPRDLYPDAVAGIQAGMVPICTEEEWLADPAKRGCFTLGDGSTNFRLPDYNGVYTGSYGPAYFGGGNAQGGAILRDRIQNITAKASQSFDWGLVANIAIVDGAFYAGDETTVKNMAGGGQQSARTGDTTRQITVEGCLAVRLFGAVQNVGSADAAALATAVAALAAKVSGLPTAGAYGFRNVIINGAMKIAQRSQFMPMAVAHNNFMYGVDRWYVGNTAGPSSNVVYSYRQVNGPNAEFPYAAQIYVTTTGPFAAGGVGVIEQPIEGLNLTGFVGKDLTISFWVKSSVVGKYSVGLALNDASPYSYITEYSISAADTWEWKSVTIPGGIPTAYVSAFDGNCRARLRFSFAGRNDTTKVGGWAAGNFFTTPNQAHAASAVGNTFNLTGVQMECGSVATPFEHRPYGLELQLCQRYYQFGSIHAFAKGTNYLGGSWLLPVQMRTTASVTFSSQGVNGRVACETPPNYGTIVNGAISAPFGLRITADANLSVSANNWWSFDYTLSAEL